MVCMSAGLRKVNLAIPVDWSIPQKACSWVLKNPFVSAVISNMSNLEKVEANLGLPGITREP